MKVSLVNPSQHTNYPQLPLGLAYLAGPLEKNGHEVSVVDANLEQLSPQQAAKSALKNSPDLVGITSMTPEIQEAITISEDIRLESEVPIVCGGPHPSALPKFTLKTVPFFDFLVVGEGELTLLELVAALEKGTSLKKINGLGFRKGKQIVLTPPRPFIKNLDSLPLPAYHLFDLKRYKPHPPHGNRRPIIPLLTSRGCPFRCLFCSKPTFGKIFRTQSPARTIEEIKYLKEKFKVKEVIFYDDSFTLDKKRILKLCQLMRDEKIGLPWSCETRVNLVDEELLSSMKSAGCYKVSYGVESGSQKILDTLRKDITLSQTKHAFELSKRIGIKTVAYFMLGSPGETSGTVKQTIDFAILLDPDFAQFSITTPYPGSDLYNLCEGEKSLCYDWESFKYMRYNREDSLPIVCKGLKRDELEKWLSTAYRRFYLRPHYFLKRLTSIRGLDDIMTNLSGLKMFSDITS